MPGRALVTQQHWPRALVTLYVLPTAGELVQVLGQQTPLDWAEVQAMERWRARQAWAPELAVQLSHLRLCALPLWY